MMTAEQMIAANKASIDTLFGLSHQAFAGVEKLVEFEELLNNFKFIVRLLQNNLVLSV